ncbi:capsular exopolysaccharide synthesis family protein [Tumebacillus sp. BK434]|uniref:polysaccharide biosynthesis tyrosine autokinase n=1 Tax=Tumebacillus sp. BK434 TaxID=2512169 RepID=UPI00104E5704|nr:polysaccharide biosynthesis tyrosine autokinase [Tumebacillus sp. BK434]TCP53862.1 capsular exopolysaccharide synthesis family protein [Tumebacillus sp. BK434]
MLGYLWKKYYNAVKKRLGLLVLIVGFAVGTSTYLSMFVVTPTYKATTALLVNTDPTISAEYLLNEVLTNQKVIKTYNEIIKSHLVLQEVIDKLHLQMSPDELGTKIKIVNNTDSSIFTITVTYPDREAAIVIANELARVFTLKIGQLMQVDNVVVVDRATMQTSSKTAPNVTMNVAIALILSTMAAIGAFGVREYLDPTMKSREEIKFETGLATIGEIGTWSPKRRWWGLKQDVAAASELPQLKLNPTKRNRRVLDGYQHLYRNLLPVLTMEDVRTIVITSTHDKEGKTTILTHLGILMAQHGHSVLLLDANAEQPVLHGLAPGGGEAGLCDLLLGAAELDETIRQSVIAGLDVLPLGRASLQALRSVAEGRLTDVMPVLRDRYDIILIDSGSMNSSLLPNALARHADGVLFVIKSGKVAREAAATAVAGLRQVSAKILGAVLNKNEANSKRPPFLLERVLQKDIEMHQGENSVSN